LILVTFLVAREGIEDHRYVAESIDIFESPDKVTPRLNPQKGWLLADVHGRHDCAPYPDLSFSSAYNDNSIIRSSS
jgi:hypothetical protein